MAFYSTDESLMNWFDELNILKTESKARYSTAKSMEEMLVAFFSKQLEDIMLGLFMLVVHSQDYENELADIYMTFTENKNDEWFTGKAKRFAKEVESTTEKAIQEAQSNPQFTQALLFNEVVNKSDLPQKVTSALSKERARRIASHEANVIHNYKRHLQLSKTQATHTWDATLDEKTRPHHYEADGQTVMIDEPFIVAGEKLMFPGDDSLGATAKNLLNCRCIEY
jgi:uncharacterized protein with gpF-like domain